MKSLLRVLIILFLGACQATRQARFDPNEYKKFDKPGNSVLSGRIWLDLGPNVRVVPERCKVILQPITSYTVEWYEREVKKGAKLGPMDPRALAYRKTAFSDEKGRFVFKNLAPGRYYVVTRVPYNFFDPDMAMDYTRYCMLYYKVNLKKGQKKDLDMTNLPGHFRMF